VTNDDVGELSVAAQTLSGAVVLDMRGVLDSGTYRRLRDEIIKTALGGPRAVVVDVTDLAVPAESAWAVFTSARWHVDRWPEVPILLVCKHSAGRSAIARNGITRYIAVHPTIEAAMDALNQSPRPRLRRRARAELPASINSLVRSRELVAEWLSAWSQTDKVAVAKVVVTSLIENVLEHTDSAPSLRLESDGSTVTVAVGDASHRQASFKEMPASTKAPTGLRIISALCRTWGNSPTTTGKTVWAVIGPENVL